MTTATSLSLFDAALLKPALCGAFAKLSPRVQWRNPVMFVVYIGSILTTLLWVQALSFAGRHRHAAGLRARGRRSGCGSPCCSPTSPKRWPKAAARRRRPRCAACARTPGPRSWPSRFHGGKWLPRAGARAAQGRRRAGRGRRRDPARRRGHRRRGLGRRERHHRRIGARGARIGRRLLGRHRRHARAVGLAGGAHHGQPGRVLPRPHDRHGRGAPSARRRRTRSR